MVLKRCCACTTLILSYDDADDDDDDDLTTLNTDEIVVYCEGVVHMSGYVMPEDEFPGPSEDMAESDDDEAEEVVDSDEDTPQRSISHYFCSSSASSLLNLLLISLQDYCFLIVTPRALCS